MFINCVYNEPVIHSFVVSVVSFFKQNNFYAQNFQASYLQIMEIFENLEQLSQTLVQKYVNNSSTTNDQNLDQEREYTNTNNTTHQNNNTYNNNNNTQNSNYNNVNNGNGNYAQQHQELHHPNAQENGYSSHKEKSNGKGSNLDENGNLVHGDDILEEQKRMDKKARKNENKKKKKKLKQAAKLLESEQAVVA